jgi:hypothetical protein
MLAHNFSNKAVAKVLGASMDNVQTTMALDSLTGLPAYPYIMFLERDTASIEAVSVTSLNAGTTVNVTRGFGDTDPVAHTAPCSVLHAVPAEFFTDYFTDAATMAADAGLKVKKLAARNSTVSIANTETRVVGVTMPTGSLAVGTVIEFEAMGIQTNTTTASTSVWRIRVGPTTLTGAICGSWTSVLGTTARTNVPFVVMGKLTILSTTTAIASISVRTDGLAYAAPSTIVTAPVTIATNAAQEVELTVISGAATTTWNAFNAYQELVAA